MAFVDAEDVSSPGLETHKKKIDENFCFGDGQIVKATKAKLYPAGVYGKHSQVSIAEVNRDCPPLLSITTVEDLGVILNFR